MFYFINDESMIFLMEKMIPYSLKTIASSTRKNKWDIFYELIK